MPSLEDVFNFSHSSDFSSYQKWFSMSERDKTDPSIKLTSNEILHLEAWASVQNIFEHVLPEAVSVLASYEGAFKTEFQKYEKAVKDLENQNKLFEFYKSVLERLTKMYLDSLSGMLTEVYREVYGTTSKQVQLQMVDFRNKKVIRLNVINHVDGKDYVEDFGNEGGSVHVVLGLIVAIYFLLSTGLPRLIFIDESLGCLYPEVHSRFMRILKEFSDRLGFCFAIISHHADRFQDFASKVYSVEDGVYRNVDRDKFFEEFI